LFILLNSHAEDRLIGVKINRVEVNLAH